MKSTWPTIRERQLQEEVVENQDQMLANQKAWVQETWLTE